VFALVLFGVTLFSYLAALQFTKRRRKWIFVVGYLLTLSPLIFFKYSRFILENFCSLLNDVGIETSQPEFSLMIPIGISFFTFQALGYLFDVYKGKIAAEHNFLDYMLFVSFFPQIVSGPISKASELLPQIKKVRSIDPQIISSGLKALLWGYFLKAVIADRLAIFVNTVDLYTIYVSGAGHLAASLAYTIQIYADFAGYSMMAVGVGRIFGFQLINNFHRPYFSESITEFWRRWHISLSRWLRDYVYIPLGGNRRGKLRTHVNILITFLISGLWHGANWTFIVWGGIHGVAQSIEKFFNLNKHVEQLWLRIPKILLTFAIVNFAWIFFRMPTISDAWLVISRIFSWAPGETIECYKIALLMVAFLFIKEVWEEFIPRPLPIAHNRYIAIRWAAYIAVVFSILLFGTLDASQFIYVNF
jgi:D-alanyl-lipoteichoic acid acyltransferase DltB (MBOAT superfamily)